MLGLDALTLLSIRLSLTSLTEADEKDDSGATTMNVGSDKRILLCDHPHVLLRRILLISFDFAVIAVGPFTFRNPCQAGTASPVSRTALSGQLSWNFPPSRHVNMYCKGVSLEEGFLRENKNPCSLWTALGFPALRSN